MTSPALSLDLDTPEVWSWFDVRRHLKTEWQRGQHVAIMAPTGTGKSYLVSHGLLPMWDHSLTIDPKPSDPDNLAHARWLGAKLTPTYPQPHLGHLWGKDPYPDKHYWINPPFGALQSNLDAALDGVWQSAKNGKGWVVYIDEIKLICARRPDGHDLAHHVTRMLRYGRARGITVIGGTQSPRYLGPGMSDFMDQPRYVFLGKTKDAAVVERYAEISGLGRKLGMAVVPKLGKHSWWLIGPDDLSVTFDMPGPKALRRPTRPST